MRDLINILTESKKQHHSTLIREHAAILARLDEIATKVKVHDGDSVHTYFVPQANPEKAKQAAIKKHRDRHGLGGKIANRELTAEIGE